MTTIKLDPGAALLLDALHGAGHAAYAVGGCVRDSLLGLDPHDWDLCTSARPEQGDGAVRGGKVHPHRPAARHRDGEAGRQAL